MLTRALIKRLEKAEQTAIMKSKVAPPTPACICFPENEQPFFLLPSQEEAAAQIACPLHGQRFRQPIFHVYVPQWRKDSESIRRQRLSSQYHRHGRPVSHRIFLMTTSSLYGGAERRMRMIENRLKHIAGELAFRTWFRRRRILETMTADELETYAVTGQWLDRPEPAFGMSR